MISQAECGGFTSRHLEDICRYANCAAHSSMYNSLCYADEGISSKCCHSYGVYVTDPSYLGRHLLPQVNLSLE